MFGYVRAYKPELRISEFEVYKAVYCGLCAEMGRRFGLWARFTLSYDFTFLALLAMGLSADAPVVTPGRCAFNPLKKANCCHSNSSLAFAADMAILMLWHKLEDNRRDEGFWKRTGAALAMARMKKCHREAVARYPQIAGTMAEDMAQQAILESEQCGEPDKICHPSAHLLGTVLESVATDESQRRVMYRLGYLLGRYVYLCDALDDLEQDGKSGGYNPLLLVAQPSENLREDAKGSLYMTIAEAGSAYELLEIQYFGPILENILYQGLRKNVEYISVPHKDREKQQKF